MLNAKQFEVAWTLYTLQTQGALCTTEDMSENSDAIMKTAISALMTRILGIAVLTMASGMEIVLLRIPTFFSFTAQDHASLTASDLELLGSNSCMAARVLGAFLPKSKP